MLSESNLKFSIDPSTASQIKALEKETIHFKSLAVDFSAVQGLLHSNKYLHLADPVGELATYLQVSREDLISQIEVWPKGKGHLPYFNSSMYKNIMVDTRFLQVNKIRIDWRPAGWSYRSKNGAYYALFLHCISNLNL
jgi:hypothetical protein